MITRRDFLKLAGLRAGVVALRPFTKLALPAFPEGERLGRIAVGKMDVCATPDGSRQPIGALYEGNLMVWIQEVVGSMPGRTNQRFVETPNGYVWRGYVQPVRNQPNAPLTSLPTTSLGPGMWAEVTVPYAVSLPLRGGSASADCSLPAVGWVSLFVGAGVAMNSTYWHNNYGEPSSCGYLNASPQDARWIFRWSLPQIPYDPGGVTVEWPGGTKVIVQA